MKTILSALAIAALAGTGVAYAECGGHTASASIKNMTVAQAETVKEEEAMSTHDAADSKLLVEEKAE